MSEMSWTQNLALAVLAQVEDALRTGIPKVGALKEAFDKATEAAVIFAREHPVYATLIALGIIVILFPWMIEALGFGFEGPIEGRSGLYSIFLYGIGGADVRLDISRELRSVLAVKVCRILAQRLIVLVLPTPGYGVEKGTNCILDRQGWLITEFVEALKDRTLVSMMQQVAGYPASSTSNRPEPVRPRKGRESALKGSLIVVIPWSLRKCRSVDGRAFCAASRMV
jgi:hypothetical protein